MIVIRNFEYNDLSKFWEMAFSDPHAEWTQWNWPYFHDTLPTRLAFLGEENVVRYVNQNLRQAIVVDGEIVGMVSAHFEDGNLHQWLEVGIVIYQQNLWGRHIGSKALRMWLDILFQMFPSLPHIGFTTWSGNQRMMTVGNKVGMKLEGRIRKVRFWQNQYYDSIKYGILRDEFTH